MHSLVINCNITKECKNHIVYAFEYHFSTWCALQSFDLGVHFFIGPNERTPKICKTPHRWTKQQTAPNLMPTWWQSTMLERNNLIYWSWTKRILQELCKKLLACQKRLLVNSICKQMKCRIRRKCWCHGCFRRKCGSTFLIIKKALMEQKWVHFYTQTKPNHTKPLGFYTSMERKWFACTQESKTFFWWNCCSEFWYLAWWFTEENEREWHQCWQVQSKSSRRWENVHLWPSEQFSSMWKGIG